MDASLRRRVQQRAGDRCEYCRLPQSAVTVTFHVEHVRARQHDGNDDADNLALACDRCNLYKGPNLTGIDPANGQITTLFDPRRDVWERHFAVVGADIVGLTPTGRTTANLLNMNALHRSELRARLLAKGDF